MSLHQPAYALLAKTDGEIQAVFSSSLTSRHVAVTPSYSLVFDEAIHFEGAPTGHGDPDKIEFGLTRVVFEQHYEDEDTLFDFFVPKGGDLDLWHFGAHPFFLESWVRSLWHFLFHRKSTIPLDGIVLRVTRPRDFLSLHFTFCNVAISVRDGKPWLVANSASAKPVLIAHFYPQHIQEETFEENSSGGTDDTNPPTTPVDATVSGPTRLAFNLSIDVKGEPLTVANLLAWKTGALRRHDDISNLSAAQQADRLHNTVFEVPYRFFMDTVEASTELSYQRCLEKTDDTTPELWHVSLVGQSVKVISAVRFGDQPGNVTITFQDAQPGWKAQDTFAVLEPQEFSGTFVLTEVAADNKIVRYTQKLPDLSRSNFTMSLANRFVAYSAADYAPPIKPGGVSFGNSTYTIQFTAAVTFKSGDVINITPPDSVDVCAVTPGPSTFTIASAAGNTITFASAPNPLVTDTALVSLLTATAIASVVIDADGATAHITTDIPHGLRGNDSTYITATNLPLDNQFFPIQSIESAHTFKVKSATPLVPGSLLNTGRIVVSRRYPITSDDRRQVIDLSSLQPLAMEQLILSALGGWASMEGNFNPNPAKQQDVKRFIYRFEQRRDYYVEVDYAGYLWPFAHRAIRVKITQRLFYSSQNSVTPTANVCYLRTRFFVVVKQKTRSFIAAPLKGLQLPFIRVDVLTDSTPALYAASPTPAGVDPTDIACSTWFWPSLGPNQPVLFKLRGYDSANPPNTVDFSAPLIWVTLEIGTNGPNPTTLAVQNGYATRTFIDGKTPRNRISFGGAPLHFADSKSPGDTELHVTSIDFSALLLDKTKPTDPLYDAQDPSVYTVPGDIDPVPAGIPATPPVIFRPILAQAAVDVPAVNVFSGKAASDLPGASNGKPVTVSYNSQYLKTAFNQVPAPSVTDPNKKVNPNPTEIFVDVIDAASLQFPGAKGGGMALPTAPITAIARHTGIVADGANSTWDPTTAAKPPAFNPLKSFDLGNAKLLGCIPLSEAVAFLGDLGASLNLVPSLNVQKIYTAVSSAADEIQQIEAKVRAAEDKLHQFNLAVQQQVNQSSNTLKTALTTWVNKEIGVVSAADANISNLAEMYSTYALQLKSTMTEMQNKAAATLASPPPNKVIPAVLQSDMDDLRAAGDIDLTTSLMETVLGQLVAADVAQLADQTSITICTLEDLHKSLTKAITVALRPLDPSRLPTQQVAAALDALLDCFDPTLGLPSLSNIRAKALALQKQLKNFLNVITSAPGQVKFDKHLFDGYLVKLTAQLKQEANQCIADIKTVAKNAISDHNVAFLALYKVFNQSYCNNTLPPTPTYAATVAQAQAYLNAATTLATAELNDQIDTTLGNLAGQVSSAADPVIGFLNDSLDYIKGLEDLCNGLLNLLETPIAVTSTYTLAKIPMQDAPASDPIFLAHRMQDGQPVKSVLEIDATVSASATPVNPAGATANASTALTLSDFSLQLLPGAPFITVQFQTFTFTAGTGQGTHSHCKLDNATPVILGGALEFVNGIASAFGPMASGGSGPVIQLFGSGIGVGYSFALPQIEGGGFQITGLAFEALLLLSFTGDPLKLRFYLATPQKHFLMSGGIFGGGGFFGLELSTAGVDLVQGCMEFGATAALDLGVADGEVHILGGIYFEFGDQRCLLTGFVRAGGSLNILGIIEMSVEFYIGLTYSKVDGQTSVYGTCTVTVSISILFFSADVSMTMQWQWAGSQSNDTASIGPDPSLPLYAMLETGGPSGGITDDASFYGPDPAKPAPVPKVNQRLVGWDEQMWDAYTSAFMKESPTHA
ncbi:hypothetical protein [Tunturiibacter lichenicola]|uniref:hypothetical protein n=1 Tax=Tunturiibacter lichenicola TaxID=2051959 RepID=UPI003D9B0FB4